MKNNNNLLVKIQIAFYVFRRILYYKSTYKYMIHSCFPSLKEYGYLNYPLTRNKIVGYLLGIESWHLLIFGKRVDNGNLLFLFASLIIAYDNAIDEEQFRDWTGFENFLKNPTEDTFTEKGSAISAAKKMILLIPESCTNRHTSPV